MLNSEPGLFSRCSIEDLLGEVSEVGVGRFKLLEFSISPHESLSEDDDVTSRSERISEVSNGLHDNFGVVGRGLVGT